MSLVKEIEDKGATVAWSPVASMPNYVALGTKDSGAGGFDDYGGELEIHRLDFADKGTKCVVAGQVKTSGKFASIAWSPMGKYAAEFQAGLLAGGMTDGTISLWDPAKLMKSHPSATLSTVKRHEGAIAGLHFNPNPSSQHLLASGGSDARVFIHALDRPDTPKTPLPPVPEQNTAKHNAEITKVQWNPEVAHILASAAVNGSCHIWDLRQKKSWCELRDAKRGAIADICWNPTQSLQIITAMGDDTNPVMNMWDLRSSTTVPLAQLQGHTQGILSMSWCPNDTSLLLSCGKDNHTFLWDLYERRPVYEFVNETKAAPAGGFGGFGMSAGRRYEVTWSPIQKAVLSTCSFDRKVQVYSISGTRTESARAPAWLRRPCSTSFGFGGKLLRFGNDEQQKPAAGTRLPRMLEVSTVVEDSELVAASRAFEASLKEKDYKRLCDTKAEAAAAVGNAHGSSVWRFIRLVFEDSARTELLQKLGFDAEKITAEVMRVTGDTAPSVDAGAPAPAAETSAEDFFGNGAEGESLDALGVKMAEEQAKTPSPPPVPTAATSLPDGMKMKMVPVPTDDSLDAVKSALVIGNFEAAVEGCFARGQLADAVMLAASGGAELWEKTRVRYFEREAKERPYLKIIAAIINQQLAALVAASDLKDWKETLAILSTYSKSDEFNGLCEQLGERLETEVNDTKSASLCYLCAINVPKTVGIWIDELKEASSKMGRVDSMSLHSLVEKVSVFTQEDRTQLSEGQGAMCDLFTQYGALLANQGEILTASKFISSQDNVSNELRHRLFYASQMDRSGAAHPPLPFEQIYVGNSPNSGAGSTGGASAAQTLGASTATSGGSSAVQQPALTPAQHPQAQQQQQQQAPQAGEVDPTTGLPLGWIWHTDPQSGRVYYQNTMTGVTQWEPPQPEPVQQSVTAPQQTMTSPQPTQSQQQQYQQQQQQQQYQQPQSQQHVQQQAQYQQPQFQQQHQQPQPTAATPEAGMDVNTGPKLPKVDGFAGGPGPKSEFAPTPTTASQSMPVVAGDMTAIPENAKAIVPALNDLQGRLAAVCASGAEKKQLADVDKAVNILLAKLSSGQVDSAIAEKATQLVTALSSGDAASASNIQKVLAAEFWDNHKDWIKGMKNLVQLCQRKLR